MKHIQPVNVAVVKPTAPVVKRAERPVGQVFMFGDENQDGETAPVGTATDGNAKHGRERPEQEAKSPDAQAQPGKPVPNAQASVPARPLDLGRDSLAMLLQMQEAEAPPPPPKPADPEEEW